MFEELYDSLSMIFSHWWPKTRGEITEVEVEVRSSRAGETARLAVAYKFYLGSDGPYTGESFLPLSTADKVAAASRKLRPQQAVTVRYRSDDPSVNRLDREVWRELKEGF
jgi:hypothetical protein